MPRYTLPAPAERIPDSIAPADFRGECLCAGCHRPLLAGEPIRQQALFKLGELDSIELGHAACVPDFDNAEVPEWCDMPDDDDWDGFSDRD